MRLTFRSFTTAAAAVVLMAGAAAAQCNPKGGCAPPPGSSPQAGAMAGPAKEKTLVGVVSDATCGRKHAMMPGKSDAECTRACVMKGSKYALVVGSKVYTLEGQPEALDKLAGEKARVRGAVSGDTVQVTSAEPAKRKKS